MDNLVFMSIVVCSCVFVVVQPTANNSTEELICLHNGSAVAIKINHDNGSCQLMSRVGNLQMSTSYVEFYVKKDVGGFPSGAPTMGISNPCQPNPCRFGGRCRFTYDNFGYRCDQCPFPMGGNRCEAVVNKTTCIRFNDTLYFIYPNRSKGWEESYQTCAKDGLTMAMIKDRLTHRFLQRKLNDYNQQVDLPIGYWVGLNRSWVGAKWTWVDGSELGAYQGWYRTHRRRFDSLCVVLIKSEQINYEMISRPCVAPFYITTSALCQINCPFLLQDSNLTSTITNCD